MDGPMLNAKEVAALLGVHLNTVKRLVQRGDLRAYRIATRGDMRFTREDVDAYLATTATK